MHYHVNTNVLISLIKRHYETYSGIQSISVATGKSVTLLLESSFLEIDNSLKTFHIYKYLLRTNRNKSS
jgi:hypothetical protein